ncbi:hypothetical protein KJZ71_04060 [Patescibacteria group bacterium]|uniref:Transcriptional regulator n=1 Tax=candidate division WWE3 bacterium TaxID=2053526 RepID=A0A928Y6D8_UNCKA|nr:hypothetical protein [candidate division WWE3 bacterium]MCL4732946.1 hypothetical protein [Patescibacteria group bacterium]MDL1952857.1 hypothetical protein [Candidatus Uhrbacteria bacterium UHB]RIL01092.1 MAG: hypothetical protein DCC77_00950 [Candidatus Uhrbacteria bacterium]
MLEHLFGSRTRVKLIALFLSQPEDPIFVREVTRRINTQINAVRRELANLTTFGLIMESRDIPDDGEKKRPGLKRKYYKLNAMFPLLPEVRSLMTKAQLLVEHKIDKELLSHDGVKYAALMGAFLGSSAPVDLFVVGSIDRTTLQRIVDKMQKAVGQEINYTVLSVKEYQYRKEMSDKFLYSIFDAPKNEVVNRLDTE